LRQLSAILKLRSSAALTLDRIDDASSDIDLMFRLADAARNEPIIISQLVRFAQMELTLQPIAQGLEQHQWTEAQLQTFQQRLEAINCCADAKHAMDAERGFLGGGVLDYFRKSSSRERFRLIKTIGDTPDSQTQGFWPCLYAGAAPTGWYYLEQMNYDEAYTKMLMPLIDLEKQRVNPSLVRQASAHLERTRSPARALIEHRVFSALLLPALEKFAEKTARVQTGVNLAALACALERCRMAQGKYPSTLDPLVPQFMRKLPHDVINGAPLHYRLTNDGQFVLYSVGWNEKDDGGTIAWDKNQKVDWNNGDWVWRYPARP
jgi:hypothetical protein